MNDLTPRGIKTAIFPINRKTKKEEHLDFIRAKLRISRYGTHHRILTNK